MAEMMPPPMMPKPPVLPGAGNTAPAAVPTNNLGTKARGIQLLGVLSKGLLEAIKLLEPTSDEGQAAIGALKSLSKVVASAGSADLGAQEMKLLGAKASGPPNPMDIKQKLSALGLGGSPGGAQSPMPPAPAGAGG